MTVNEFAPKNENTKERILALLKTSKDTDGRIDIGEFRRKNPSEYALLNHYFGSVTAAVDMVQGVKVARTQRRVTLRDSLAYERLVQLREDNTLDDIAKERGVTRMAINQLFHALEASVKEAEAESIAEAEAESKSTPTSEGN